MDSGLLGLCCVVALGACLGLLPLVVFVRSRMDKKSMIWKAVYNPRSWWISHSRQSSNAFVNRNKLPPIIDGVLGIVPDRQRGSAADDDMRHLQAATPTSAQAPRNIVSLYSDNELYLRFLALCLRVTALFALVCLASLLPLFGVGIPKLSQQHRVSVLDQWTAERLLIAFDGSDTSITGVNSSTRLIIWTSVSLVVIVLAWVIVLREYRFLANHVNRFRRDHCDRLEVVFFPSVNGNGWQHIGENAMVSWVRACGIGPPGAEGGGEALRAIGLPKPNQFEDSSDGGRFVIHAVFTVGDHTQLVDVAEERNKALVRLEVAEANYISAFVQSDTTDTPPSTRDEDMEEVSSGSLLKWIKSKKSQNGVKPSITPYGPSGHYTLGHRKRLVSNGWGKSKSQLPPLGGEPRRDVENALGRTWVGANFNEVDQDSNLHHSAYMRKYHVGDRLRVDEFGQLASVPPGQPSPAKPEFMTQARHPFSLIRRPTYPVPIPETQDESALDPDFGVGRRDRRNTTVLSNLSTGRESDDGDVSHIDPHRDSHDVGPSSQASPTATTTPSSSGHPISSRSRAGTGEANLSGIPLDAIPSPPSTIRTNSLSPPNSKLGVGSSRGRARMNLSRPTTPETSPTLLTARPSILSKTPRSPMSPRMDRPLLFAEPDIDEYRSHKPIGLAMPPFKGKSRALASELTTPAFTTSSNIPNHLVKPNVFQAEFRPRSSIGPSQLEALYQEVRTARSGLRQLNEKFEKVKLENLMHIEEGGNVKGWMMVGENVSMLQNSIKMESVTREDVQWQHLRQKSVGAHVKYILSVFVLVFLAGACVGVASTLSMSASNGVGDRIAPLESIGRERKLPRALVTVVAPTLLVSFTLLISIQFLKHVTSQIGFASKATSVRLCLETIVVAFSALFVVWFVMVSSVVNASHQIHDGLGVTNQLANGAISSSSLLICWLSFVTLMIPFYMLGHVRHFSRITAALKNRQTPRQRFHSLKPIALDLVGSYGVTCVVLVSTLAFAPVAPLITIPGLGFCILMYFVERRNVYRLYRRDMETGGTHQLVLIQGLIIGLVLSGILLGLILLSRSRFLLSTISFSIASIIFVTSIIYMVWTERRPTRSRLSKLTRQALEVFEDGPDLIDNNDDVRRQRLSSLINFNNNNFSSTNQRRSIASVLELLDAALVPSSLEDNSRPVPVQSEEVDDLVDMTLAIRSRPNAPPFLPDLTRYRRQRGRGQEGYEMLYHPVLSQVSPQVWLPKDILAREEANDMIHYWSLTALWEDSITPKELNL